MKMGNEASCSRSPIGGRVPARIARYGEDEESLSSMMGSVQIRLTLQRAAVDRTASPGALVGSILTDCASALSADVGAAGIGTPGTLERLARRFARLRVDCALSFEYAVHDALRRSDARVAERVATALREYCGLEGTVPASILLGIGKNRAATLIDTPQHLAAAGSSVRWLVADDTPLERWIETCVECFHSEGAYHLPSSILGYWRPKLLLGYAEQGVWVPSSFVDHSGDDLGFRVRLMPIEQDAGDHVRRRDLHLVVCPIPFDGVFLSLFRRAWRIVRALLAPDANKHVYDRATDPMDVRLEGLLKKRREWDLDDLLFSLASNAPSSCFTGEVRRVDVVELGFRATSLGAVLVPVAQFRAGAQLRT